MGGKFSGPQRDIYEVVLEAHRRSVEAAGPFRRMIRDVAQDGRRFALDLRGSLSSACVKGEVAVCVLSFLMCIPFGLRARVLCA